MQTGYDPVCDARPLKRTIQTHLETPIARLIVGGKVRDGGTIKVDLSDGILSFNVVQVHKPAALTSEKSTI